MTPTIFAGLSVVINIALSLLLFAWLQHVGIAIATSVAAWANALLLAVVLARRGHFKLSAHQYMQNFALLAISAAMGAALWFGAGLVPDILTGEQGLIIQAIVLLGMVGVGAIAYFALVHFSGVQRIGALKRAFKQG